ncbi:hypothetical protein [Sulfurimonas sp.]
MTDIENFLILYLSDTGIYYQLLMLFILYIIGPAIMIPILFISYLSGFLFGSAVGLFVAMGGYIFTSLFYYYIGKYIHRIPLVKKRVVLLKKRYKFFFIDTNIFAISFLALVVPFIILAPFLGLIKKRKRIVIGGLFIGALPSLFFTVQAGGLSREFIETKDSTMIMYSIVYLVVLYVINKFIIDKFSKRMSNDKT